MGFRPCPKPEKEEKKKPKPIQRKTPIARSNKPIAKSNKPIRKKSSELAKLEKNREPLTKGVCWKCGTPNNLHKHEIYYGDNRKMSMVYNMVVELCGWDHDIGPESVHLDPDHKLDNELKIWGQKKFEEIHPDKNFIAIFGRNYV